MKKVFAASGIALALMAGAATAANVMTIVGNSSALIGSNYDPAPSGGGLATDGTVSVDVASSVGFGLKLNDEADVTFTYLGKEAGNLNLLFAGSKLFSTETGALNETFTLLGVTANATGFLPFSFTSAGATVADNGISYASNSSIAFKVLQDDPDIARVLVMLNDPGADTDYDDMVLEILIDADKNGNIPTTPIPGGVVLLMSGLAGLGYMGRLRRTKKA